MDPWPVLAAVLVLSLSLLFAVLFTQRRRHIRYLLRNRLTPLRVLGEEPTAIDGWRSWVMVTVVVVVTLVVVALV